MEEIKELINKANEWLDKTFSPNGKMVFLAVVFLAVACVAYFSAGFVQNQNASVDEDTEIVAVEETEEANNEDEEKNELELESMDITSHDTLVNLTIEDTGRANPFQPGDEAPLPELKKDYNGYNLMAPPDGLTGDANASEVIQTKVSGILFDMVKPSAILNISGSDYLVRPGDHINGYKVLSISKDLVTVQLGSNVYKAHVGEVVNGKVATNQTTIYDLEHSFGGARDKRNKNEK